MGTVRSNLLIGKLFSGLLFFKGLPKLVRDVTYDIFVPTKKTDYVVKKTSEVYFLRNE